MKLTTKFDVQQRIYIKELKIWGRIMALNLSTRLEYQVRYFDKVELKNIWLLEDELSNKEENDAIGF